MGKNDFSDLEDQIVSAVTKALNAIDVANLKREFSDKTEDALSGFKAKFNEYSKIIENKYIKVNKKNKNEIAKYISKKPVGSVSGIVYMIFGTLGSFVFGLLSFIFLIFTIFFGGLVSNFYIAFGAMLIFLGTSVIMLLKGVNLRKRVQRFKKYVRFIDDNSYFLIKDLARFTKEKEDFVVKELNKMINQGMFLEGHIDEEKNYFILNDDVYRDYLNLKRKQLKKENLYKNDNVSDDKNSSAKNETEVIIKMGRDYIEEIRNVRKDLYRENIAIKLDKLQSIATQIIDYVEKNPNKIQEVNKFINHYLPITIKLINSYKDLNKQLIQGDNISNAKNEIEKSIDLIETAFENLLDDLFEDVALDVSTDISVLKTLFKQEGLTEEDFKK